MNDETKKRIAKRERLLKELDKEVEILKVLLNTNNIRYINLQKPIAKIENLKMIIDSLETEINIYSDE